jgi:hypothetical protein
MLMLMLMLIDVRVAGPVEQLTLIVDDFIPFIPFFFHPFSGRSNHLDISLTFIHYLRWGQAFMPRTIRVRQYNLDCFC